MGWVFFFFFFPYVWIKKKKLCELRLLASTGLEYPHNSRNSLQSQEQAELKFNSLLGWEVTHFPAVLVPLGISNCTSQAAPQ